MNPRHRLVTWVRFLALTAAHPDRAFEAATIGRATTARRAATTVTVVRLPRMAPEVALGHLASLAALFDDGMCEPLPLACKTSAAYAEALRDGRDAAKAAERGVGERVELPARGPGARAPCSARAFGGVLSLARRADWLGPRASTRSARAGCGTALLGWEQVAYA